MKPLKNLNNAFFISCLLVLIPSLLGGFLWLFWEVTDALKSWGEGIIQQIQILHEEGVISNEGLIVIGMISAIVGLTLFVWMLLMFDDLNKKIPPPTVGGGEKGEQNHA